MSKNDWSRPDIVSSWIKEIGGPESPCGDDWRCALVNPLVTATAVNLLRGGGSQTSCAALAGIEGFPIWMGLAPTAGAASIAESRKRFQANLTGLAEQQSLDGLGVVDVGCGEGYLGRLLVPLGASYVGIDGSKPLLDEASKRFPKKRRDAEFIHADLDGAELEPETIGRHLTDGCNLILAVVVLDHLEDPTGLLESLSTALSSSRFNSVALLVALNPAYFLAANAVEDPKRDVVGRGIRTDATIASTGGVVSCFLRSDRDHLCLFRRSWLRVIHSSPVGFWHVPFPEAERSNERGIPPFLAYLVAGKPPRAPWSEVKRMLAEVLKGEPPNLLATLPEAQKKEIRANLKKIDLARFDPEEVVLERGNLGGDLFLLVEGAAHLELPEGPDQLFGPGDLLGDLETGPDGRVGSYLYRVRAASQGATFLRFEAELVERLIGHQSWLSSGLFEQLRDRLAINLWSFSHYDRPGRDVRLLTDEEGGFARQRRSDAIKAQRVKICEDLGLDDRDERVRVVPKQLDIMSRLLLQGAEYERLDGHRDARGRAAFLSMEVLKQRSPRASKASSEEQEALKHLVLYGWVDAFPGSSVRESIPETYRALWREAVDAASETLLRPTFSSGSSERKGNWSSVSQMVTVGGASLASQALEQMMFAFDRRTRRPCWSRATMTLRMELERSLPSAEWFDAVERWFRFLYRVNAFWYDKSPCLFLVRDAGALRTFALGSNQELSRVVIGRSRICTAPRYSRLFKKNGSPREWSVITASAAADEPGRLKLYGREVNRFFLADLANRSGGMLFSGEPSGYTYPETESRP